MEKLKYEWLEKHFQAWLKRTVHWTEREIVETNIKRLLKKHPDLIERGYSWPKIREITERSE